MPTLLDLSRHNADPLPDQKAEADRYLRLHEAHYLVKDLHRPNPLIYWSDLLLTSLIGWTAFALTVSSRFLSPQMILAGSISALALYRGLSFLHEISHQHSNALSGFEAAWNLIIGYPLLMPSFFYVGVHADHHKLNTYGTIRDPEYLPFANSWLLTTLFAVNAVWVPALLMIRFLLLTPLGFLSSRIADLLVIHASSLTMNLRYRREITPDLMRRVQRDSAICWLLWITAGLCAVFGLLPWRTFLVWLAVVALIALLNAVRTLGAHAYESTGEPLDRAGQLLDSIDTPGAVWTELWAPVGLRYHALHHYFPGIPYHHLGEGYRRLSGTLPLARDYKKMTSRSLLHSLRKLYRKGFGRQ